MKRLICLCLLLCLLPAAGGAETFVYGASELGRDLVCHRLGDENAEKSVLLTFATHAFEGKFDRDGQVLVDIAHLIIGHYEQHPEALQGYALYVVPCVNPDALAEGTTEDGFGRANALGIDINRDFPVRWRSFAMKNYRNGDAPFASAEARALRDLVDRIRPTCAVDVHGYIYCVMGSRTMARYFTNTLGLPYRDYQSGGMLVQWMETQTEHAVLLELASSPNREGFAQRNAEGIIAGLELWLGSDPVKK